MGHDAIAEVQVAVFPQRALFPVPFVHFVNGLVQFGDDRGRQRVFDDQVAVLVEVFPLRIGHRGVLVSVIHVSSRSSGQNVHIARAPQ